ncbi:MAG: 50S ribosomal protein L6 [Gammaproteobacteria bacterium]|nr:MAG: 50S ribosomal protein L6 [Gammaproteobacteria bacterium]
MSRIAKTPVEIPSDVKVDIKDGHIKVKGPKGEMERMIHPTVMMSQDGSILSFSMKKEGDKMAMAGTMRSLVHNMMIGASKGFVKKLTLVGVGYRAQVKGKVLDLTLGFSHPVEHAIPEHILIETPSQTEVVISGPDKQRVGQVAAEIRAYRPPEPYKGKGVRYSDEQISLKEAKKK